MSDDSSNTTPIPQSRSFPRLPWGVATALLILVLAFGVLQFLAGFIVYLLPILFGVGPAARDDWLLNSPLSTFLLILIYQALGMGVLVWFLRRRKVSIKDVLGLQRPKWRDFGYALLGWVVYFIVFVFTISILQAVTNINTKQEQAIGFSTNQGVAGLIMAFVGLVVLTPIFEEIFFRGFLYGTLRSRGMKSLWATLITSVIFASLHLLGAAEGGLLWIGFVDTLLLSFVLCYVRERIGSLWPSIGIHAIKNGLAYISLFILAVV